ncbi:MAG TPA: MFS transporter [bacterium]|nr:MFS transporter [bacterium]
MGDQEKASIMQSWTTVLTLFCIASVIETIGVGQIVAFLPLDLKAMGLPQTAIPRWVGLLNALMFVLGLPLVPLWGVLADKYSRKLVIARSAVVEALVFGLVALSRHPWELAGSLLLVGFQLGNTGVMLAAIRDVTPRGRLGIAIAIFGATSPIGFAAGPALGGLLLDHLHTSISTVYAVSSALSVASAAMLMVGLREIRPTVVPPGSILALAFGAMRGVFTDAATRRLFALFGFALLARQMSGSFLPLAVGRVTGGGAGLASAIALVVGTAALVGGIISPGAGAIGDRVGFRPVLIASLLGAGVALAVIPAAPSVSWLAATSAVVAACSASASAMVFGLLVVEVPPERRSATLNLVYLPLYLAGIVGPALGALVVTAGLQAVFYAAALVVWAGAALELMRPRCPAPVPE